MKHHTGPNHCIIYEMLLFLVVLEGEYLIGGFNKGWCVSGQGRQTLLLYQKQAGFSSTPLCEI